VGVVWILRLQVVLMPKQIKEVEKNMIGVLKQIAVSEIVFTRIELLMMLCLDSWKPNM
jgi:hypothetical protein